MKRFTVVFTALMILITHSQLVLAEEGDTAEIGIEPVITENEDQELDEIPSDQTEEADETEEPESPEIQEEESESDTDENIEELIPEDDPAEQIDEQETDTADEPAETDEPVAETQEEEIEAADQVNIIYTAHLSNVGWTEEFRNSESSAYGRMEALTIHTDTDPDKLSIKYQVHVQNIGWMNTVEMNGIAGTTGCSLQIEAIRINLSGSDAGNYNVFYRTYVKDFGWTDWGVNGKTSGSEGLGKAIYQIEIALLRYDDNSITPGMAPRINDIGIQYSAHVQNIGWQSYVLSPSTAGTTGRALRLEAITIKLANGLEKKGGIQGRGHVQNLGWINSSSSAGSTALTIGTVGKGLRLEALELSLTGELGNTYDIYYRTHVQQLGWMGWAKNGESSGSSGKSLAVEAIEIRITPKNTAALFLDSKPPFSENLKVGFYYETINGARVKVYYDENHNIVKKSFKLNQTYYQIDENTGAVIHEQKLFTDKIYMEGIDISEHNGAIDLSKYQNGFVIIRLGWWTTEDKLARRNMDLCEKYNIPYGVYLYDYTTDPSETLQEAEFVLKMIKGRNIRCGVWFDMEDADGWKERNGLPPDDERISLICQTFCQKIQEAGYHTGIYASYYWFENYIRDVDQYDKWVAHWGINDGKWNIDLSGYGSMHQYTSKGGLDKDVMYVDPEFFR